MRAGGPSEAVSYFAIALGLAIAGHLIAPANRAVTMIMPAAAVAIMLIWVAPVPGGLGGALAGLGLTRPGLRAWSLAVGAPAAIHLSGLVVLVGSGLTVLIAPADPASTARIATGLLAGLGVGVVLALCEEIGWRGYILPRLVGIGTLAAMLLVGFMQGVWHLPLLLTEHFGSSGGNPWWMVPLYLLTFTLAGVFFGFLRVWTASIWPVAIAHATAYTAWKLADRVGQTSSPLARDYLGGESGLIVIVGLVILDAALIAVMRSAAWRDRHGPRVG